MAQFISRLAASMAGLAPAAHISSGPFAPSAPSQIIESDPGEFVVELQPTVGAESISTFDVKTLS